MTCVAEGVETVEIADQLRTYGCDLAQGYLFSRPVGASELLDTLASFDPLPVRR